MAICKPIQQGQWLNCQIHKQKIDFVILQETIPFEELLLCKIGNGKRTFAAKTLGFSNVLESIKEQYKTWEEQQLGKRECSKQAIRKLQQLIEQYQQNSIEMANRIMSITKKWIEDLSQSESSVIGSNLLKELEKYYSRNFQGIDDTFIPQKNKLHIAKLLPALKDLIKKSTTDIQNCFTQLTKIKQLSANLTNPSSLELVSQIKQKEMANFPCFNMSGSLMFAGSNSDIQVWKFDKGNLTTQQLLKGHTSLVQSLAVSKKINWFTSGSRDIRTWKLNQGQWQGKLAENKHKGQIISLLINKEENELISGSSNGEIYIWKLNCNSNNLENDLKYDYALKEDNQGAIFALSMNDNNSALLTCSKGQIYYWIVIKAE